jgi:hypothetical protein
MGFARDANIPDTRIKIDTHGPMPTGIGNLHAIEEFAGRVANIIEPDYGDWMRRTNAYLLELEEELVDASPDIWETLDEIQRFIQYNPDWDVHRAAKMVVSMAIDLRDRLGARQHYKLEDYDIEACP